MRLSVPVVLAVAIFLFSLYVWNVVKFVSCDFESPFKCEVVHGIGLFPPLAPIMAWFDTDN